MRLGCSMGRRGSGGIGDRLEPADGNSWSVPAITTEYSTRCISWERYVCTLPVRRKRRWSSLDRKAFPAGGGELLHKDGVEEDAEMPGGWVACAG